MRLLTLVLLGILGMAGTGYSQEIPEGMKKIMEQLQIDPKAESGFDYAKESMFIGSDVQFKDWFVGLPIEFYRLNDVALDKAETSNKVTELIVSTNMWRIPIRINGYYIYHVKVFLENNKYKSIGCGEGVIGFHAWDTLRKKYPEESGVRPIVIDLREGNFIHFPNKKDGKSLFCSRNPKWNDELSKITSKSLDDMDDDVKIIKYWKDNWAKNKERRRKFFEKNPDLFKDTSGGKK